jgi:hypothetical protein
MLRKKEKRRSKMSILTSMLLHDHYVQPSCKIQHPEWEFIKRLCLVVYEPPTPDGDNVEEQLARCVLLGCWCDDGTPMSPVLSFNIEDLACWLYKTGLSKQQRDVCEMVSQWVGVVEEPITDVEVIIHNSKKSREDRRHLHVNMLHPRGHMTDCTFAITKHDDAPADVNAQWAVVAIANPDNYLSCHATRKEAEETARHIAKCFKGKVLKVVKE